MFWIFFPVIVVVRLKVWNNFHIFLEMEIFLLHEHSRASFDFLSSNAAKRNKNFDSLELLDSRLFLLKCHFPEMKYQHRMQKFMSSQFHPEALKSLFFLHVFVSPSFEVLLRSFFLATSIMRLHRRIFHDTKTLLSETFFSISTQPLFYPFFLRQTCVKPEKIEMPACKKNFCSKLNRREINLLSQLFLQPGNKFLSK